MSAAEPQISGPIDRVMVGTDRSETAERAVRWAATFADAFGAELHIVQVVLAPNPGGTQYGAAEATRAAGAADDLGIYARQVAGDRGQAHVVLHDDPAMAIVEAAEEHDIDVLVVGNAGMAGRKEFLLGNVPNRISHNARCTVIIVNTAAPDGSTTVQKATVRSGTAIRGSAADLHETEPRLMARGSHIAAVFAKHGMKELFGRPDEDGAVGRQRQAKRLRSALGRARADVRQARPGAVDATRPVAARVHRGARDAAGPREPADGGRPSCR